MQEGILGRLKELMKLLCRVLLVQYWCRARTLGWPVEEAGGRSTVRAPGGYPFHLLDLPQVLLAPLRAMVQFQT